MTDSRQPGERAAMAEAIEQCAIEAGERSPEGVSSHTMLGDMWDRRINELRHAAPPAIRGTGQGPASELLEAIQTVIEWENDYRTKNHLGKNPPQCFMHLATLAAKGTGREPLREALEDIRRVASGERQVAVDDTEGMAWIDKCAREALAAPAAAPPAPSHPLYETMKDTLDLIAEKVNGGEYHGFVTHVVMPAVLGALHRNGYSPASAPPAKVDEPSRICDMCKHSMENNSHGLDQNDLYMDGDIVGYTGSCTYCRICNPTIFEKEKP